VLADLLAERACAGLGPIAEVQVAYWIDDWRPTGTSLVSRFEAMGRECFEHDRGVACARQRFPRTSFFEFPPPVGRRRVGPYPVPEVFTIPWHIDVDRLTTRLTTSTLVPAPLGRFWPAMANAAGALMRTPGCVAVGLTGRCESLARSGESRAMRTKAASCPTSGVVGVLSCRRPLSHRRGQRPTTRPCRIGLSAERLDAPMKSAKPTSSAVGAK
jgi:hypothetical protein